MASTKTFLSLGAPGDQNLVFTSVGLTDLPVGSNGQVLSTVAGVASWTTPAAINSSVGIYTLSGTTNINVNSAITLPLTVVTSAHSSITPNGGGEFRVLVAGTLRTMLQTIITNASATDWATITFEKNGTPYLTTRCPSVAQGIPINVGLPVTVAVNDIIRVRVVQGGATTLQQINLTAATTQFIVTATP